MISLGRAFFYTGARSLVTTLWRVDDSRMTGLSSAFYRALADGSGKARALADAQRVYLAKLTPEEKLYGHPAYWSALIVIGNAEPVRFSGRQRGQLGLLIGICGVAVALLSVLLFRRFRSLARTPDS
jgi:hypothetical protein